MIFEVRLPKWASWIAQDKAGDWWAFKECPTVGVHIWNASEEVDSWWDDFELICDGVPPKNWKLELYRVTWK